MKKTIALILALTLILATALCGCGQKAKTAGEFTLASTLAPEEQQKIDELLAKFMTCYEENNAKDALPLLTDDFGATEEALASFFDQIHALSRNPFVPYDSYYMNGLTVSEALIKVKKAESDENYIELTPAHKELYCAMYASEGEKISYMMTLMLTRSGDGFRIAFINPTDFKYNGESAQALFDKTVALYKEDKLIASYITSCMVGNTLRPGGYMRYSNDVEMEDMCYKLYTEISDKFKLPLTLEGTSGSAVYEIGIANDEAHGIIPLFLIKTDVKVSDKAALEKEAETVISAIEKLSPGIRGAFSYARINATNDNLDENTTSVNSETVTIALG